METEVYVETDNDIIFFKFYRGGILRYGINDRYVGSLGLEEWRNMDYERRTEFVQNCIREMLNHVNNMLVYEVMSSIGHSFSDTGNSLMSERLGELLRNAHNR